MSRNVVILGVMDTGIRELRDHPSRYLDLVRQGQENTVTDHGRPMARLVPLDAPRVIDRLIAVGVVMPARVPKRRREGRLPTAKGSVSELVAQQRR